MPFEQTRDVIERARAFHRDLADRFHRMEREADRDKVRMLLDFLAGHEERMERNLAAFENATAASMLDTWFAYPLPDDLCQSAARISLTAEMSVPEIISAALQLDECLQGLYRYAAEAAPSPEVRDLFLSLLEEAKAERAKLMFGLAEPGD